MNALPALRVRVAALLATAACSSYPSFTKPPPQCITSADCALGSCVLNQCVFHGSQGGSPGAGGNPAVGAGGGINLQGGSGGSGGSGGGEPVGPGGAAQGGAAGGAGTQGAAGGAAGDGQGGGNHCKDGMKDADESDIDCGGSCPPCVVGSVCFHGSDCASGSCAQMKCLSLSFAVSKQSVSKDIAALLAVDVNKDGALDLITANIADPGVTVLLNDKAGNFSLQPAAMVGIASGEGPNTIASGDFNGDGNPDIVAAVRNNRAIYLLAGNGSGSFLSAPIVTKIDSDPHTLGVGDFNGDGKLDVVVIASGMTPLSLLLGKGDGTFEAQQPVPLVQALSMLSDTLLVADLNGDGHADLLIAGTGGGFLTLLGKGDSTFGNAMGNAAPFVPTAFALGDANGDGLLDLFATEDASSQVAVFKGDGTGLFGGITQFALDSKGSSIGVADFDGDKTLDLCAGVVDKGVDVALAPTGGQFTSLAMVASGAAKTFVIARDFNGDGKPDIAAAGQLGSLTVLLNQTP